MSEVEFSIVIPARDEEAYIRGALRSVLEQRYPLDRVEVVVVDNGSRDRTAEVVSGFSGEHPDLRLRLIREPTPGRARAKNLGVAAAQGRWVVFLDADSRMSPDLLDAIARRTASGEQAGSITVLADSEDPVDQGFFALLEFGKRLFGIRAQMFYCARDLFNHFGMLDAQLQIAEDLEFLQRLRRGGIQVGHVVEAAIYTSPRRLRALPLRLGVLVVFFRWALAHVGIGRRWPY
jgi:glycosyltransferase involved in cell wall biosynthesis